ncbi:hypothetical protein C8J57DRAFT_1211390 [Mycena rebaudengoi]|nr:hypothetical protein C8J57DRAFT_1211390 [Mycena rebaudengoi]
MCREYHHLMLLKRRGRAHDPTGVKGMSPGELDWENALNEDRFLYILFLALDGCFRMKCGLVSSEIKDPGLGMGWAYVTEGVPYRDNLLTKTNQMERLTMQIPNFRVVTVAWGLEWVYAQGMSLYSPQESGTCKGRMCPAYRQHPCFRLPPYVGSRTGLRWITQVLSYSSLGSVYNTSEGLQAACESWAWAERHNGLPLESLELAEVDALGTDLRRHVDAAITQSKCYILSQRKTGIVLWDSEGGISAEHGGINVDCGKDGRMRTVPRMATDPKVE